MKKQSLKKQYKTPKVVTYELNARATLLAGSGPFEDPGDGGDI